MTWSRFLTWLVVGAAAVAGVMLKDVGGLLADIQTAGARSYGAGVFTGFRLDVFDVSELVDAIEVWRLERDIVLRLLRWHAAVDALAFVPAFALILRRVLRGVGASATFATGVAIVYFFSDELETILSGIVLGNLVGSSAPVGAKFWLVLMQVLSLVKWIAIFAAAVVAVVALVRSEKGIRARHATDALAQARTGGEQSPALALSGLIALVGVFAGMVALPGGGALDQIPDVIREHLTEGSLGLWALSTLGFTLFVAAVVVAGLAATSPRGATAHGTPLSNRVVLGGAAALSAALVALAWAIDGKFRPAACAPVIVAVALWAAAQVAVIAGVAGSPPQAHADVTQSTWPARVVLWVGSLAGVAGIASGVGLVRAAFPPFVLGIHDGSFPWWLATLFGVAGALVAGSLFQTGVAAIAAVPPRVHRVVTGAVVALVVGAAIWLAVASGAAPLWGSTGVVGVGLGFWALVIGTLVWVSRTRPRWDVTRCLGFGARTPWGTLLLVVGLVASVLNTEGGYHDARLVSTAEAPRYQDLDTAFSAWLGATEAACTPGEGESVPMVFAAAPGGGIRSAYWTTSVLDSVFPRPCAASYLFAASGVSGGSVGLATWVTAAGQGLSPTHAVTEMSADVALSRALAGLLLRDIPQPFTGITTGWDDRAALMERGWSSATGIFGPSDAPTPWTRVGDGGDLPFVPVLSLNGSSVTDGCRVLVTNVAQLPATEGPDCQGVPGPRSPAIGPVSGSIDPFVGLHGREGGPCDTTSVDIPITTGALLSARFPVVSPSGALARCVRGEEITTYVVDGGYYENSGLLSLLQIWDGVEEDVRSHNHAVEAGTATGPLGDNLIEPWFLLVDNHYRAPAKKVPPGRPLELLAPLEASGQDVLSQTMLEQAAIWEMEFRFARIAPVVHPGVEAPLGWVLSRASRDDLDGQLVYQLGHPDESLAVLLGLLGVDG